MKRITRSLLALALLPALVNAGQPASASPAPAAVLQCHYEAEISGSHTLSSGMTIAVPIGRIVVTSCSSPADLVQRVEELTNRVRAQATAQAAGRQP